MEHMKKAAQRGVLISIDPGVHGCGVAIWIDSKLQAAGYAAERRGLRTTAEAVRLFVSQNCSPRVERLVVEVPQVYRPSEQKGDQKDLIDLTFVAGQVAGILENVTRCSTLTVQPREWKGQAPKPVSRARSIAALDADEENAVVLPRSRKKQLDVWDAVGIGLWRLGR